MKRCCQPVSLAVAVLAHTFVRVQCALAKGELIQGVCYGPFPSKHSISQQTQLLDDFMSDVAKPLWGPRGRGDLGIIRGLGANTVRLYGNDPNQSHQAFLEEAQRQDLKVVPGISDWPYLQSPDSCKNTDFDCYQQVKQAYLANLRTGWLVGSSYHPALRHVIVINEPDLKLKRPGEIMSPEAFSKGIISAVDGMLDAEKEAGVRGNLIKFTATFSFGLCLSCGLKAEGQDPNGKPAVNQMLELRNAFLNPQKYGYAPRNDLKAFFETRFLNSVNTANPAAEIPRLFLDSYEHHFPDTAVAIEEFHHVMAVLNQEQEVTTILDIARKSKVLLGISFFEYQVRYDKGGTEMAFGMFALGDYKITSLSYFGIEYPVWCLKPVVEALPDGTEVPKDIQAAYGGSGVDFATLCSPSAASVPLDKAGLEAIRADPRHVATFVQRVIEHLGGEVMNQRGLQGFAQRFVSAQPPQDFDSLVSQLRQQKPRWVRWDPNAACVADRAADADTVGKAIAFACEQTAFNCGNIPSQCKDTVWRQADYVFSVYYNLKQGNPMETCYLHGSAIFAASTYYFPKDSSCVVSKDPETTPITDEGYQMVINQHDPDKTAKFFRRVILIEFGASVGDNRALMAFAAAPPSSMYDVKGLLRDAQWICGGTTGRPCLGMAGDDGRLWWMKYAFFSLAGVGLCGICCTVVYVRMHSVWRKMEKCCSPVFGGAASDSDSDVD